LHKPHSDLSFFGSDGITTCNPHRSIQDGQTGTIHTAKTIQAAAAICELIRLPTDLRFHSHYLACVVTLASLVHLSLWSSSNSPNEMIRQTIRLDIGVIESFAKVWPIGAIILGQIKSATKEILVSKKPVNTVYC
jgi:hypothetical protein